MFRRFLGLNSERRHDRRFNGEGAWLICHGQRLPLVDLSLSGLRVCHAPPLVHPGDEVEFTLDLPMPVRSLNAHGRARVMRVAHGEIALHYSSVDQKLMRTLHFFLGGRIPVPERVH